MFSETLHFVVQLDIYSNREEKKNVLKEGFFIATQIKVDNYLDARITNKD